MCLECNVEMVYEKQQWYKCPICCCLYRERTSRQVEIQNIAELDQLIAGTDNPDVRKFLRRTLARIFKFKRHRERLRKSGFIIEEDKQEEWKFE
jgi:hypothetical protein